MSQAVDALPDDPETLKAMLIAERVRSERLRQETAHEPWRFAGASAAHRNDRRRRGQGLPVWDCQESCVRGRLRGYA
jgi:hypothetical protein